MVSLGSEPQQRLSTAPSILPTRVGELEPSIRKVIAVGMLVLLIGTASPPSIADPGADQDAGDSPEEATVLPEEGTYNGTITTLDDDWYRLDIEEDHTVCLRVVLEGDIASTITLSPNSQLDPAVSRDMAPGKVLDMAMAIEPTDTAFLGIEASSLLDTGDYTFDLQAFTVFELPWDEGGDGDAGDSPSDATPLPGICQVGHLSPKQGDTADVYSFEIGEDEHLGLSLIQVGASPVELELISPVGEVVTSITDGAFEDVTIDQAGTWYLSFQTSSTDDPVAYIGGITINGPEPPPCKPTCLD